MSNHSFVDREQELTRSCCSVNERECGFFSLFVDILDFMSFDQCRDVITDSA